MTLMNMKHHDSNTELSYKMTRKQKKCTLFKYLAFCCITESLPALYIALHNALPLEHSKLSDDMMVYLSTYPFCTINKPLQTGVTKE
jgi:hypothetical protein